VATATTTEAPPLTEKQAAILTFFYDAVMAVGRIPTYREAMAHFGIRSPNALCGHMNRLEAKGYITLAGNRVSFLRWPDGAPFRGLARV
jgi:SOS-response transcriptional repressor LexA